MQRNHSKYLNIISYILSISFILSIFLMSVHFWCFNETFYKIEHNKILLNNQHINEYIGISNDELDSLTSFTLSYLNNPNASLDLKMNINGTDREVYTNDEKSHMVDVRRLNLLSINVLVICIIVFIISFILYIKYNNGYYLLFNNYKKTLFAIIIFSLILVIWIFVDFDSFWTLFHKIFFSGNDLWLLDLRKDILIMIVPPQFFNDLVIRILFAFIIIIVTVFILLYLITKNKKEYI